MVDPKRKKYLYLTLSGFGAISLSILFFFALYRMQGIGEAFKSVAGILAPFVYGGVVAYLLRPVCNTYERFLNKHLPHKLKRLASGTAVFGSLLTGVLLIYATIAMIIPQLYESIVALGKTVPAGIERFIAWLEATFGDNEDMDMILAFFSTSYDKISDTMKGWVREISPQIATLLTSVGSSVVSIFQSLYNLVMGLIVAVYVLFSRKRFARQSTLIVRSVLSEKWANMLLDEVALVDRMFGGFIDSKILDSLIIGILCYLGCWILGMPNILLVSVVVGVTNIIPFFGPFIGGVPCTLLIMVESPIKALWFVVFVFLLQQLDGNVIGPAIMGNRIGISSFWVMFAIIFFGGIWGLTGMIVGVPLFAVIYDLVRKLVKHGLEKKGKIELWEKYAADYPNENVPHSEDSQKQWDWEAARQGAKRLLAQALYTLKVIWSAIKICWAFVCKCAGRVWGFTCSAAAWLGGKWEKPKKKKKKK